MSRRRVGLVGYGSLGAYLAHNILDDAAIAQKLEIAFVWNRSAEKIRSDPKIPQHLILDSLDDFATFGADLIVEVSHPDITEKYGAAFLEHADYIVGSPTAFCNASLEIKCRETAASKHGLFVPVGALWGARDIQKMADRKSLHGLTITMKKHPSSFRVHGSVQQALDAAIQANTEGEVVLYDGPVRQLCSMAPNNTNTMAVAALAAHNLGFDGTRARLVSDRSLEAHVIDVEVLGPTSGEDTFRVSTCRHNPAKPGAVTGKATFESFLSSILSAAQAAGSLGIQLC